MDEAATTTRVPRAAQAPDTDVLFRTRSLMLENRLHLSAMVLDRDRDRRGARPTHDLMALAQNRLRECRRGLGGPSDNA